MFLLRLHNSVYIAFDPKDDNMQLVLHHVKMLHYVCDIIAEHKFLKRLEHTLIKSTNETHLTSSLVLNPKLH